MESSLSSASSGALWKRSQYPGMEHIRDTNPLGTNLLAGITESQWSPEGDLLLISGNDQAKILAYPSGEVLAQVSANVKINVVDWHPNGQAAMLGRLYCDLSDNMTIALRAGDYAHASQLSSDGRRLLIQRTETTEIRSAFPPFTLLHPAQSSPLRQQSRLLGVGDRYALGMGKNKILVRDATTGETLGT